MKFSKVLIPLVAVALIYATNVLAQGGPSAAETAANLRVQLADLQAEEGELKARIQQLDLDLRPENIERYFAGTGSTRPEELREQRRRQLQGEKDRLLARLEQLAATRTQLESAIVAADAEAYQQSAQDPISREVNQMLGARYLTTVRLMAGVLVVLAVVGTLVLVLFIHRRRRLRFTTP